MKGLRRNLQSIVKALNVLTQRTNKLEKQLQKLEKEKTPTRQTAKPKAKARKKAVARKSTRVTATDTVLNIIYKRKNGATTTQIKEKTGFPEKKIWDIVNRAKREGKVKSPGKGVYMKA